MLSRNMNTDLSLHDRMQNCNIVPLYWINVKYIFPTIHSRWDKTTSLNVLIPQLLNFPLSEVWEEKCIYFSSQTSQRITKQNLYFKRRKPLSKIADAEKVTLLALLICWFTMLLVQPEEAFYNSVQNVENLHNGETASMRK